jgi:hypothetical protein
MRTAVRRGWTITRTSSGHLKWRAPDGSVATVTPSTPGEGRAIANTRADLRRAGLDIA